MQKRWLLGSLGKEQTLNGHRTTGDSCSKIDIAALSKYVTQTKLQVDEGLKCGRQNPKILGDHAGYLCDLGVRNNFLHRIQKSVNKRVTYKSDHIKIKSLCLRTPEFGRYL